MQRGWLGSLAIVGLVYSPCPTDPVAPDGGADPAAEIPQISVAGPVFLVRNGLGTEEEALAYYESLSPEGVAAEGTTLQEWRDRFFGELPVVGAFYRNQNELGFWREMTCTAEIDRGVGGCAVTNWSDPAVRAAAGANLGTVAMRLDEEGRTQFFVFGAGGRLSPSAELDDEGPKFVPRLCTNCHGGKYGGAGADPDLGSLFREFEPSRLERPAGVDAATAEREWAELNAAIRGAHVRTRSEAEGGPEGVDASRATLETYMTEMYVSLDPPVSRSDDDLVHLPPSWRQLGSGGITDEVWTLVVNPYCQTCHRLIPDLDFSNHLAFRVLTDPSEGTPLLERYLDVELANRDRSTIPFMPQSKVQWQNLHTDIDAQLAIAAQLEGD